MNELPILMNGAMVRDTAERRKNDEVPIGSILSRDELADISGRKQQGKIADWLAANGYRFDVAADGWPRVLRAAVDAKLMPSPGTRIAPATEASSFTHLRSNNSKCVI